MDPLRGTLLWASGNATLREHLPRFRAVRKTVERFMPGETAEDGLNAAQRLATEGLPATFTLLGENVDDMSQAAAAAGEYLRLLDRIDALGLDAEVSVKLTQLGFDLEPEATMVHMERLADRSADMGRTVWIDMESSAYVDGTIDLYSSLLARSPNSGLCLQAYLHRTWDDVQKLAPMSPTIRLVKGAYREPKDVAFQDKRLIDESYFRLASHLVTSCRRLALGTHDTDLVARIEAAVPGGRDAFEVAMLYGIRVGRATPVGAGGLPRADVDRVRPVLVPVVHATDRREAGREHAPRAEERAVTTGLHGAIAAAVTPLRDGGRHLDDEAFAPLVRSLAAGGVDGLLACGTTGEGVLLSVDERKRVVESFLASRPDGFQVAVHAGAQTTADSIALAAHALEAGADAVALIAPPYFPLDPEELLRHFVSVADACEPLPFYIYEFAGRSGYAIPIDVIGRIRERCANVRGMKVSDTPFAAGRAVPRRSKGWTCSSATSRWSWKGWSVGRSARSAAWRRPSRRSRRRWCTTGANARTSRSRCSDPASRASRSTRR